MSGARWTVAVGMLLLAGCETRTYCHPSMVEQDGGGIYFNRDQDGGGVYFERDGGGIYFNRDDVDESRQYICRRGVLAPPLDLPTTENERRE